MIKIKSNDQIIPIQLNVEVILINVVNYLITINNY